MHDTREKWLAAHLEEFRTWTAEVWSCRRSAAGCDNLPLKRDTLSAPDKHSNYGGLEIPSAHYSYNEHGKLEQMCSGTGFFQCVGEYSIITEVNIPP